MNFFARKEGHLIVQKINRYRVVKSAVYMKVLACRHLLAITSLTRTHRRTIIEVLPCLESGKKAQCTITCRMVQARSCGAWVDFLVEGREAILGYVWLPCS
jgi:hypothetical protein